MYFGWSRTRYIEDRVGQGALGKSGHTYIEVNTAICCFSIHGYIEDRADRYIEDRVSTTFNMNFFSQNTKSRSRLTFFLSRFSKWFGVLLVRSQQLTHTHTHTHICTCACTHVWTTVHN